MKIFLEYLYSASLPKNLSFEIAEALYPPANKYQIGGLIEVCHSAIKDQLNEARATQVATLADLYSDESLKIAAFDAIEPVGLPANKIPGWYDLPSDLLKEIHQYLFWGDESNNFTSRVCRCRHPELVCIGNGRGRHRPNRGRHVSNWECKVPGHHVTKCGACEEDIRLGVWSIPKI